MRYLYYCNSTYQLLNILNLHWHRKNAGFESIDDYKADLMIQNSFEGAPQIAEIIRSENTFESVLLANKVYNSGRFHKLETLSDLVFPLRYMKKKQNISKQEIYHRYDVLCVPKYTTLVDLIWRLNRNAKLHLYEDGIGSYHLNLLFGPRSKLYSKARTLLNYNSFEDYDYLYLVNKDMYMGKDPEKVVEFPKYDRGYLNRIREIFAPFCEKYEEKDIYWLSQFLNNEEFNRMLAQILETLADYKEDVLFCQHPRTHMDNVHGFAETDGKQIWELQVLNMNNISKKLFISIHSTACFTAKMLYDEEPYIIMFYRMGDKKVTSVTDNFEESVRRFISSYRDPDKVMLPENLDEFKNCVEKYYSQTGKSKAD